MNEFTLILSFLFGLIQTFCLLQFFLLPLNCELFITYTGCSPGFIHGIMLLILWIGGVVTFEINHMIYREDISFAMLKNGRIIGVVINILLTVGCIVVSRIYNKKHEERNTQSNN